MSLKNLFNSKYKENVVYKLGVVYNNNLYMTEQLLKEYLDRGYSDRDIFRILHDEYWKNKSIIKDSQKEVRAKKKANELKYLLKGVKYDNTSYLDIGSEEFELPLAYSKVLNIDDIHCVNIDNWESHFDVNRYEADKYNFKYYNGTDLPYQPESFSAISCNMVMHHVCSEDRKKLLPDINRILMKRGILIIREHDSMDDLFNEYMDFVHRYYDALLLRKFHWVDKYHTYYQSEKRWREEIERYGFKIIRSRINYRRVDRTYMHIYVKI